MSELINGKEALIALVNGEEVEYFDTRETFKSIGWTDAKGMQAWLFIQSTDGLYKFRIKPKTILLNGIEVPAPFEPKDGERVWFICDDNDFGYAKSESYGDEIKSFYGWWHTEDEIKQVVSALRSIFKGEL